MGQSVSNYFTSKTTQENSFEELGEFLSRAKYVVVLSGAGISQPSGIPTFRDPSDGIWNNHDVKTCATIWGFNHKPSGLWKLLYDFIVTSNPKPNSAHYAITELQKMGIVKSIITQNVDNLHQESGSHSVIEFHGNLMESKCRQCHRLEPIPKEEFRARAPSSPPPLFPLQCKSCGGILKPNAVLFGEGIPEDAARRAREEARKCDVMLVVGTSASVSPASELPWLAFRSIPPARIVEINKEPTALTHRVSDILVMGCATQLFKTVEACKKTREAASA